DDLAVVEQQAFRAASLVDHRETPVGRSRRRVEAIGVMDVRALFFSVEREAPPPAHPIDQHIAAPGERTDVFGRQDAGREHELQPSNAHTGRPINAAALIVGSRALYPDWTAGLRPAL